MSDVLPTCLKEVFGSFDGLGDDLWKRTNFVVEDYGILGLPDVPEHEGK